MDIGDLLSFVRKPVEFFYKKHGIIFDIYEKQLPDSEKFSIDDDYIERQELTGELVNAGLRDFMAGMGADDPMSETQKALRLFALRGQSAEGSFGRSETEELLKGVQKSGIFEAVREKPQSSILYRPRPYRRASPMAEPGTGYPERCRSIGVMLTAIAMCSS